MASGVDALYLSARVDLPTPFVAHLEDCRQWAVEAKRRTPCEIGKTIFGISPFGWGKYRFCLDHQMARIGFSTSQFLPTVRIQPRAESLHAMGPAAVVSSLQETLGQQLGALRFGVSRVDLFSDWQGWSLTLDDARRFVCRADARRTYGQNGILTGFEFGTRKTKTVSARLYDKTAEIAAKGNEWWHEVWGGRYEPGAAVHRLEFEIGRQGLTEFDLNTPSQVLAAAGDLWAYVTRHWLTHRSPTGDRTRSRWPLSPEWQTIQRATLPPTRRHRPAAVVTPDVLDRQAAAGSDRLSRLLRRPDRHRGHRRHRRCRRATSTQLRSHQPHLVRPPNRTSTERAGTPVTAEGPDYARVAAALVTIGLRLVSEKGKREESGNVDGGLLPGVDGGTGSRGLLDRRAG